jgi:hypothetical protein
LCASFAQREIAAQPEAARVDDPAVFGSLLPRGRQQPPGVDCGRCVLLELEEHCALGAAFFSEEAAHATRCAEHTRDAPGDAMIRASARFICMIIDMNDADGDLRIARTHADNALGAIDLTESPSDDEF